MNEHSVESGLPGEPDWVVHMPGDEDVPDIVRAVEVRWVADGDPIPCACGHGHRPRLEHRDGRRTNLAPQYAVCDDPACSCPALRRPTSPADGRTDGAKP